MPDRPVEHATSIAIDPTWGGRVPNPIAMATREHDVRIKLRQRLYQCPGCWSYFLIGKPEGGGHIECECGERATLIDLRERRDQPLTQDAF